MFVNRSVLIRRNPAQLNYGIAVTDIDGDGEFEFFVAGYGFSNLVLKWTGDHLETVTPPLLADPARQAIGVAAGDLDGDGSEELYILNTDSFAGQKMFADRLFDRVDGQWTDLFSLSMNRSILNLTAGRSVVALDRDGDGLYGFFVANYGGPLRLYELDADGRLRDMAPEIGLNLTTGGRSALAAPLVTPRMDLFVGTEGGPNFLFANTGEGHYEEVAESAGVTDPEQHARGVALLDANDDGQFDLICGSWEGTHRLFIQKLGGVFEDQAPLDMAFSSRVRTVIAADFDNDGYEEIFFNNIGQPNRLFARREGVWRMISPGEAHESAGLGTGAAVADLDGDGRLELLIAHGESGLQPLSYYHPEPNANHWFRVLPLTPMGAPARGALVILNAGGREQRRVIDGGSGYLCQMEPVAHFGLGPLTRVERLEVRWPDGTNRVFENQSADALLRVRHPFTF